MVSLSHIPLRILKYVLVLLSGSLFHFYKWRDIACEGRRGEVVYTDGDLEGGTSIASFINGTAW